jgi:1-acyl-sn-glycerol-3-phosphate acyltransferase
MTKERSCARRWTYDLTRVVARLGAVVSCQIRCDGRQWIAPSGGGLVCANHQSYLDPVLVGLACDRRLNYLAREDLFRLAILGPLIQWYGAIPIERDGFGLSGMKETLRRLKRGELVLVFPEGTRTRDGSVGPLKSGICTLARRAQVPLYPATINGAFEAWPRHARWPRWGRIRVRFSRPIPAEALPALTDDAILEHLASALAVPPAASTVAACKPMPATRARVGLSAGDVA